MTEPTGFTHLVPGFEFLQGLVKNAGAALPGIGQWVAPTLDPAELEQRIKELRTVQFWLEQNARMLGATIQALEVQRMTLSTLKTMNVQMEDLRESLQIRLPAAAATPAARAPTAATPSAAPAAAPARAPAPAPAPAATPAAAKGAVDPLQWWGSLTQQFTELATAAMKDTATDARNLTSAGLKKSLDTANQAVHKATSAPAKPARRSAAKTAAKTPTRKKAAPRP